MVTEGKRRILLVDEHATVRCILRLMLESDGCQVEEAENGEQARLALERSPYDLIVTDMAMPDCLGDEIVTTLRNVRPDAKIIAISGALLPNEINLAGADVFLEKPVHCNTLLAAVARLG